MRAATDVVTRMELLEEARFPNAITPPGDI
jgi:hypothetical protein